MKEITTSVEESNDSISINGDEARQIINSQVQILRRLNDELLRTIRLHILLGGGVATGVSVLGVNTLGPQIFSPLRVLGWLLVVTFTSMMFIFWFGRLGSARISYTNLQLGVVNGEIPVFSEQEVEKSDTGLLMGLWSGVTAIPKTFQLVFDPPNINNIEQELNKNREEHSMLAKNHAECVKHNSWVLKTREAYVNQVQTQLFVHLLLIVGGLLLLLAL